eukprot:jgi/Botrbrau1/4569/Bobra.60_2s0055.1
MPEAAAPLPAPQGSVSGGAESGGPHLPVTLKGTAGAGTSAGDIQPAEHGRPHDHSNQGDAVPVRTDSAKVPDQQQAAARVAVSPAVEGLDKSASLGPGRDVAPSTEPVSRSRSPRRAPNGQLPGSTHVEKAASTSVAEAAVQPPAVQWQESAPGRRQKFLCRGRSQPELLKPSVGGGAGSAAGSLGVGVKQGEEKSKDLQDASGEEEEEARALSMPLEDGGPSLSGRGEAAAPRAAQLQFRLTDGATLRGEFPSDTPLREVKAWLDLHRTDGGRRYVLVIPFPHRVLGEPDLQRSLKELDLAPRASLLLRPDQDPGTSRSHRGGGSLLDCLLKFLGFFTSSPEPQAGGIPPPEEATPAPYQQGQGRPKPARGGPYSNVHGLHSSRPDDDNPQNDYWNGNSTQFRGDD